jgi:hypothetical protein
MLLRKICCAGSGVKHLSINKQCSVYGAKKCTLPVQKKANPINGRISGMNGRKDRIIRLKMLRHFRNHLK